MKKVLFVHKYGEGDFEIERIWCTDLGNSLYSVDNIPFVVKRVALGDIITIEFDEEEGEYYFESFVEVSGNATIRLYFDDETMIEGVRMELRKFGCESEVFLKRKIIAVDIPKTVNYKPIKDYLDNGEANKLWEYEEACLSHDY